MFHTPDNMKASSTAYVVPITATTAPVKSFDSLRECAGEVRVTANKKATAPTTHAITIRTLVSTIGPSKWDKLTPAQTRCESARSLRCVRRRRRQHHLVEIADQHI